MTKEVIVESFELDHTNFFRHVSSSISFFLIIAQLSVEENTREEGDKWLLKWGIETRILGSFSISIKGRSVKIIAEIDWFSLENLFVNFVKI